MEVRSSKDYKQNEIKNVVAHNIANDSSSKGLRSHVACQHRPRRVWANVCINLTFLWNCCSTFSF